MKFLLLAFILIGCSSKQQPPNFNQNVRAAAQSPKGAHESLMQPYQQRPLITQKITDRSSGVAILAGAAIGIMLLKRSPI